jgi:hypothetical protein
MLPTLSTYSHNKNFITQEVNKEIQRCLPPDENWFSFCSFDVSRLQCEQLTLKNGKTLFTLLKEPLIKLGLKIYPEVIHPRYYKKDDWLDWHSDYSHLPKYNEDLVYECILVLKNTSDSVTKFKINVNGGVNGGVNDGESEESVYTNENDLLIVCRHGITHCVTKVTEGERLTLKFTCIKL